MGENALPIRSWMFVPGDSERKLAKAPGLGADVVIIDLEDAVAPGAKAEARGTTRRWLEDVRAAEAVEGAPQYWVRINPLDTPLWHQDVEAVIAGKPAGLMVPKAGGPEQLRRLVEMLYEIEPRNGIAPGSTRLLPLVSETPRAAISIPAYGMGEVEMPRLAGLTWGAEDLSAAIGAGRKRDAHGRWTDAFRMVRATVLLTAHAAGVAAIDTLHADFRDVAGLRRVARDAYQDGFAGMLAIHPSQVEHINAAFTPSETELAEARAIVDLFAANPGAGALQLDGRMVDQPHLVQAQKLLAQAS
ncbi:HpcH/HpaI aldolase/citrate lyase family protein [Aurantiacibacter luteus]|uniref:Citrate lyase n=1 Tax=Aurantiacibacter luteus TaxID=1581420 RepID=A0A0G9MNR9_9SPHN|nr:CoA ester lyase [Aurantiacibacter luteus]KLE32355.1 citrate lyase [Aurantiacibacter luteus]